MMGIGQEIGGEFMKTVMILGILLGGLALFTLFSISIWLLVFVCILITATWFGGRYVFLGHL